MSKTSNPFAFPCETNLLDDDPKTAAHDFKVRHPGMTLRDYFAAKALNGMLSHSTRYKPKSQRQSFHEAISEEAYQLADAMLKQREIKDLPPAA